MNHNEIEPGIESPVKPSPEEAIFELNAEIEVAEREQAAATVFRGTALAATGVRQLVDIVGSDTSRLQESDDPFGDRHYVKRAPKFRDLVTDESRDMPFRYFVREGEYRTMTEHQGLEQLDAFLNEFIQAVFDSKGREVKGVERAYAENLLAQAKSIKEDLTFIGWEEYNEAVEGLGMHWKRLMMDNPDLQLCIPAEVGNFVRYKRYDNRKSDDLVREDVVLTFSDEEMTAFGDRIVGTLDGITQSPENVRIILVDDWTISGRQMRELHKTVVLGHPLGAEVARNGNIEINLITASMKRLQDGLYLNPHKPERGALPVYAYFSSHEAKGATLGENLGHVTGQHSAVNYDFYDRLKAMARLHHRLGGPGRRVLGLARIEPWYRTVASVVVSEDGKLVKKQPDEVNNES